MTKKYEFQWLPQSGPHIHCFQVELEFVNVGFYEGRKTLGAGTRTKNMASTLGIEPELLWWEASALTTAPFLPFPNVPMDS